MKSKMLKAKRARMHVAEQLRAQSFQEEQRAQDTEKMTTYFCRLLMKYFLKVMYLMN